MFNLFYLDQKLVLRSDLLKPQSRTELVLKLKYKSLAPPLGPALSCNYLKHGSLLLELHISFPSALMPWIAFCVVYLYVWEATDHPVSSL